MANIDYEEGKKYGLSEMEIEDLLSYSPELIAALIIEHPDSRFFIEKTFLKNGMELNWKEIENSLYYELESPYNDPDEGIDYEWQEKIKKALQALDLPLERQDEDYPKGAELDIEPTPLDEMEQEAIDEWRAHEKDHQEVYSTDVLEEMLKQELARNEAKSKELEELEKAHRQALIQKIIQAQAEGKKLDQELAEVRAKLQDAR